MKRVLSWVVLWGGAVIASYLVEFACRLVALGAAQLAGVGAAAFILLLVIGGSTIVGALGTGTFLLSTGIVFASQMCQKSRKGTRYKLCGGFYLAWYVAIAVLMMVGVVRAASPFAAYATAVCMAVFAVMLIVVGKGKAEDDGPPPSRVEILQKKLDRAIEKEAEGNGHNS